MTDLLSRLRAAMADGLIEPGSVVCAVVEHAGGCRLLSGGDCSCLPSITLTTRGGVHRLDPNGDISKECIQ